MMYKVVTGNIDHDGMQRIHFKSANVDDCFRFIFNRMNSEIKAVRNTTKGMYVVDSFDEIIPMIPMSAFTKKST